MLQDSLPRHQQTHVQKPNPRLPSTDFDYDADTDVEQLTSPLDKPTSTSQCRPLASTHRAPPPSSTETRIPAVEQISCSSSQSQYDSVSMQRSVSQESGSSLQNSTAADTNSQQTIISSSPARSSVAPATTASDEPGKPPFSSVTSMESISSMPAQQQYSRLPAVEDISPCSSPGVKLPSSPKSLITFDECVSPPIEDSTASTPSVKKNKEEPGLVAAAEPVAIAPQQDVWDPSYGADSPRPAPPQPSKNDCKVPPVKELVVEHAKQPEVISQGLQGYKIPRIPAAGNAAADAHIAKDSSDQSTIKLTDVKDPSPKEGASTKKQLSLAAYRAKMKQSTTTRASIEAAAANTPSGKSSARIAPPIPPMATSSASSTASSGIPQLMADSLRKTKEWLAASTEALERERRLSQSSTISDDKSTPTKDEPSSTGKTAARSKAEKQSKASYTSSTSKKPVKPPPQPSQTASEPKPLDDTVDLLAKLGNPDRVRSLVDSLLAKDAGNKDLAVSRELLMKKVDAVLRNDEKLRAKLERKRIGENAPSTEKGAATLKEARAKHRVAKEPAIRDYSPTSTERSAIQVKTSTSA